MFVASTKFAQIMLQWPIMACSRGADATCLFVEVLHPVNFDNVIHIKS